jgi:hypothetical protein
MLIRETVTFYCENHTEHMNTLCVDKTQNLSDAIKQAINVVTIVFYRTDTNCRIPWVKHICSRTSVSVVTTTNTWQQKLNKPFRYKDESYTRAQISWHEPKSELRTGITSLPEDTSHELSFASDMQNMITCAAPLTCPNGDCIIHSSY